MSRRRSPRWGRTLAVASCAIGALTLWAACGLNVLGGTAPDGTVPDGGNDAAANEDREAAPQPIECSSDRSICGEKCVDFKTDQNHCGQCDNKCADGETCKDGVCGVLCLSESIACNGTCADTKSDPLHCGSCTNACGDGGTPFCADGGCVPNCTDIGLELCAPTAPALAYCADTKTDPKNCGACGKVCAKNQICSASNCTDVCSTTSEVGDLFAGNMTGCKGKVGFGSRGTLCPAGSHVCSAGEWVSKRANKAPSFIYWVNEALAWEGSNQNCSVDVVSAASKYSSCTNPMRVCNNYSDSLGNECYWKNCGYKTRQPNQFFGGCTGNVSAGTLCCKNN